jgi:nucleoside-diphosphate-sugar epimerase
VEKGRERVRVAVVGGASGVRRSIVDLLVSEGHDVVTAPRGSQRPPLEGCRALVHVPDQLPHTLGSSWSQRWPAHDQVHAHGVRRLVDQACAAGVRRIVHLSGSWLYADQGDDWVTERSPVCVNSATEPLAVGEMAVQDSADCVRTSIVLRLGQVVGDTPLTRWTLRAAAAGRPYGVGDPDGFAHLVHSDDVATAVLASLDAPSGIYNVGAAPVTRADLVSAYARAVDGHFLGPVTRRLAGSRLEPFERSLRVSSDQFSSATGWSPRHATFSPAWFEAAENLLVLR